MNGYDMQCFMEDSVVFLYIGCVYVILLTNALRMSSAEAPTDIALHESVEKQLCAGIKNANKCITE